MTCLACYRTIALALLVAACGPKTNDSDTNAATDTDATTDANTTDANTTDANTSTDADTSNAADNATRTMRSAVVSEAWPGPSPYSDVGVRPRDWVRSDHEGHVPMGIGSVAAEFISAPGIARFVIQARKPDSCWDLAPAKAPGRSGRGFSS